MDFYYPIDITKGRKVYCKELTNSNLINIQKYIETSDNELLCQYLDDLIQDLLKEPTDLNFLDKFLILINIRKNCLGGTLDLVSKDKTKNAISLSYIEKLIIDNFQEKKFVEEYNGIKITCSFPIKISFFNSFYDYISKIQIENEEIKLSMDLNTRQVFSFAQADKYESRRAVEDETSFINYGEPTFREPFFFSSGSFKSFGQTFLKVSSLTLTMNNNLTDKRYVGIGNKSIQNSIPAQRTYEVSFTGYVSDDKLYTELLNEDENNDSSAGNMLELNFTKDNGEEFTLKFTDYMVSSNNFPIPDDKGPIEVETTIMPRNLNSCTVKTHWILQG